MEFVSTPEIKRHDAFNVIALSLICVVNVVFMYRTTEIEKIGTPQLGADTVDLFYVLFGVFSAYLAIDTTWIIVQPKCIPSSPAAILIHHLATFLITLVPFNDTQFSWHMGLALLVEFNTVFLTLKRNMQKGSPLQVLFEVLFYVSWVVLRLGMLPGFVWFLVREHQRYNLIVGSYVNMMLGAVILSAIITGLGFKWTFDLVIKQLSPKKSRTK